MGRGSFVYLSYSAFVLLSRVSSSDAKADIWGVDIWQGPAPSPEDGPPFSANATRDRSLLPYQIIGIVGAYIGSILILGTLLLTVGRRFRLRAQTMTTTKRPQEMVKPMVRNFDPSPISPASNRSWYKLRGKRSTTSSMRSGVSNGRSPGMDSVVSFDNNVIESDRARRAEEMEKLYAAVMAQDDRKGQANGGGAQLQNRRPPKLITDDPTLRHLQVSGSGPTSPTTPKSAVRAIYPPHANLPSGPQSPTSPVKAEYPNYSYQSDLRHNRENPSAGSDAPAASPKKLRKSLRNIKISAPMVKDDNSDGARTPLSPRSYVDPGIPPEPPTARTNDSENYPPTTPGTGRSWRFREGHGSDDEDIDEIRDLPLSSPQRINANPYHNQAQALTDAASTRPDPTKTATPTTSGNGSLPFREMNRQYAAERAQQASAFPLSPGHWNARSPGAQTPYLTSAGPVKTTFVDARRDRLGPGPRTGQATPYSPYMPFTPVTPVTPHLTSRAERRQRQKEERAVHGAITEEEAVKDEDELWSSGY